MENHHPPAVSVVVPLFNKETAIRRCIESVVGQTFPDWEMVIVDDGSTDRSREIVESIPDKRIRLISQANSGVSAARNLGIAKAKAPWIAFLDADDEWKPRFLEVLLAATRVNPEIGFLSANQEAGERRQLCHPHDWESGFQDYLKLCRGYRTPVNSSNCIVKRELILTTSGFVEGQKIFEDWTCWMKLACRGRYYFVNEALSVYHDDAADSASRASRKPAAIAKDIGTLLSSAEAMLASPTTEPPIQGPLKDYLNRFLLRSACPFLLLNGGTRECLRMLARVRWRRCGVSDYRAAMLIARRFIKVLLFRGAKATKPSEESGTPPAAVGNPSEPHTK